MSHDDVIESHWSPKADRGRLLQRILEGLAAAGADLERLTPEDLAPVDEFHIRGREATQELAAYADVPRGARVLDVGSGIGGPSRLLAADLGCRVTGIDLTPEYCEVAADLAARTGLADRVGYRVGSALDLPFDDGSFDLVWTQHVSMNVADKARMFAEMARVTRPGGQVVVYDPIAGSGVPILFPVPWAESPEINHLIASDTTRELLEGVGLTVRRWRDVTERSITWFRARFEQARSLSGPPPVGLHLLLGDRWPLMAQNMLRNLEGGHIVVIQSVLEKRHEDQRPGWGPSPNAPCERS
jgi:SAM-dependent methyltransferase